MFTQWTDKTLIGLVDGPLRHELGSRSWPIGTGVLTVLILYRCHLGLLYGANLAVRIHDEYRNIFLSSQAIYGG